MAAGPSKQTGCSFDDLEPFPSDFRVVPFVVDVRDSTRVVIFSLCDVRRKHNPQDPAVTIEYSRDDNFLQVVRFPKRSEAGKPLFHAKGINSLSEATMIEWADKSESTGSIGSITLTVTPKTLEEVITLSNDYDPHNSLLVTLERLEGTSSISRNDGKVVCGIKRSVIGPSVTCKIKTEISSVEKLLILMYVVKLSICYYKTADYPIPVGYLSKMKEQDVAIPRTSINVITYSLSTMGNIRLRVGPFAGEKRYMYALNMDDRIFFTAEIFVKYPDTDLEVKDSYGQALFTAKKLFVGHDLEIYFGDEMMCKVEGSSLGGGFFFCKNKTSEHDTKFYNGENEVTMIAKYPEYSGKETNLIPMAKMSEMKIELAETSTLIAQTIYEKESLLVKFEDDHTIPGGYKMQIIIYAIKLFYTYCNKQYKSQLCIPHIGYIQE